MPDITENTYTMKAYKFDGRLHYEQTLYLVSHKDGVLTLAGRKGRKLKHYTRDAVYTFDKNTLEYFFEDEWFTAALIFDDEGNVEQVYCNIAFPSEVKDDVVSFIDLDVDVLVKNGRIEVVDIDEFEEHKVIYKYGQKIEKKVFETVEQLKKRINEGKFPFDRKILAKD